MKKISGLLLILSILTSCNLDSKDPATENKNEEIVAQKPKQISDLPWTALVDSTTQKIKMVESTEVAIQDLDSSNITEVLTRKYPEVKIIWQKQQHDTAFVKIPNAEVLTQGSGTMGADIFMAEVTYSYTQIPGINFVNFSFKEGDHASPGTFNRSDFSFNK
jgi:hypothetical protein